jgi:hypothetical protein
MQKRGDVMLESRIYTFNHLLQSIYRQNEQKWRLRISLSQAAFVLECLKLFAVEKNLRWWCGKEVLYSNYKFHSKTPTG